MHKLEITGYSDDIVFISSEHLRDEYPITWNKVNYLHLNDGTIISAEYSPPNEENTFWKFECINQALNSNVKIETYPDEDGLSYKVIIESIKPIDKAFISISEEGITRSELLDWFDSYFDPQDLSTDLLKQIWEECG